MDAAIYLRLPYNRPLPRRFLATVLATPSREGVTMKKTVLMAAILVLAACGPKKTETPAADSSAAVQAPAAPAPAPVDTMVHDTSAMHHDSTMARDSMHKK